MKMSAAPSSNGNIADILMGNIPSATTAVRAGTRDDRRGTDWWVNTQSGSQLSVDAKVRSQDYSLRGYDDLALETWSVIENEKVGWTLDETKRTDYVLWLWTKTGRWALVPFAMLQGVFKREHKAWVQQYGAHQQRTAWRGGHYHSECVFVPRREVWAAIYRTYGGAQPTPLD